MIVFTEKVKHLRKIADALALLKHENLLNRENFNLIIAHEFSAEITYQFAQALVVLRNNQFDPHWIAVVHQSKEPLALAFSLSEMNKASLLSSDNFEAIKAIKPLNCFFRLLRLLNRFKLLNEENFENLIKMDGVLSGFPVYKKLSKLQTVSEIFLRNCFSTVLANYLNQETKVLEIEQLITGNLRFRKPSINRAQSTHVVSVYRSAVQSAKRFLDKYGEKVENVPLEQRFSEIVTELKQFNQIEPVEHRAAVNALETIISRSDFIEPNTNLSLKKLFMLLWAGIHDEAECIASLEDAKKLLMEGLYEIQRGGNLDVYGEDNGLPDENICCAGAFNKLIEKMVGIHSFAELIILTPELAAIKFPLLVKEKVESYLLGLERERVILQYDLLKEEGVSMVWPHIVSDVRESILEEFSEVYQDESGNIDENFEQLMASHTDLEIDPKLLTSMQSSYALQKLQLSTFSESCGESSGLQRLRRSIGDCIRTQHEKLKTYRPFVSSDAELGYFLAFTMGFVNAHERESIVEKVEALQAIKKRSAHGKDTLVRPIQSDYLWRNAERLLTETSQIDTSNLIEFNNGTGKKVYIAIRRETVNEKLIYSVYCSEINKEQFLIFDSNIAIDEILELYKQLLYPNESYFDITTRCFIVPNLGEKPCASSESF